MTLNATSKEKAPRSRVGEAERVCGSDVEGEGIDVQGYEAHSSAEEDKSDYVDLVDFADRLTSETDGRIRAFQEDSEARLLEGVCFRGDKNIAHGLSIPMHPPAPLAPRRP